MKGKLLLVSLILLVAVISFFMGYSFKKVQIDEAIFYLEAARDSHQYYADHPDISAPWEVIPGQDAQWVEIYTWIINLLK